MIKGFNKTKFEQLNRNWLEDKKNFSSRKVDIKDFFIKYMLDNRVLANYIWEPCLPDLNCEFDYPIMAIETIDVTAPHIHLKEFDRSFLSIAEMFDLSHDFYLDLNVMNPKLRLTCDDRNIKISSLEMARDKPICPSLKRFIDTQKIAVNCDFIRSKKEYLTSLEKALEK